MVCKLARGWHHLGSLATIRSFHFHSLAFALRLSRASSPSAPARTSMSLSSAEKPSSMRIASLWVPGSSIVVNDDPACGDKAGVLLS